MYRQILCGSFPVPPDGSVDRLAMTAGQAAMMQSPHPAGEAPVAVTGQWTCRADGISVAIRGRPRWRNGGPVQDPAERLLQEYRRRGEACVGELQGEFAVAVLDATAERALLAVDRMGIQPLAYAIGADGQLIFATDLDAVCRHPAVRPRLDPQALYTYLYFHMIPSPDTVYAGISRVPPGHMVIRHRDKMQVRRYWRVSHRQDKRVDLDAAARALFELLEGSVRRLALPDSTGAFLSGGLDSSTVAGLLSRVSGSPAKAFSIGFQAEGFDELSYARTAVDHLGLDGYEYYVTPDDIADTIGRIARHYDQPFGNSSAIPTYFCARLAKQHGCTRLLAGDGGDELFGGNTRYVRQKVFDLYHRLPRALRRKLIEPASKWLPESGPLVPLRKLRSYIDQAKLPMPDRLETWNLMFRTPADEIVEPGLLAAIDTDHPLKLMRAVYAESGADSLIDRMLFLDWHFTLADNDLRKVGGMCELAEIEVAYPMLDDAVVDFSIDLPASFKVRGHELRYFYRRAMCHFLPEKTIRKSKHGFGLPFGAWLKSAARLQDLVYSSLNDLKKQRIVRADFIDRLVEDHRSGHPSYYGYVIWDLVMLQEWLASRGLSL